MSFFDRLSNLGRGTIKNAFSGDEASPADPLARELEKLHRAYTSGILTVTEYEAKRAALVGGSARPAPMQAGPRTTAAPRTPITPPEAPAPDAPDESNWPDTGPVKRTL
ncbi:MAG: SHOCT domain-containing protein [Myxococcota bacterium]|nr:SHOCT domain-containing protein [Myxococcota bacterium]